MANDLNGRITFQEPIIKTASLAVCSRSTSVEDARILLDMLGLVPDPVRFPSWDVTPRSVRRAPQGASAPLPPAAYGGVSPEPPA